MKRRHFLFGSLAAVLPSRARAAAGRKILIVLVDGFGPEYLQRSDMPNLKRMCREGAWKTGRAVIPSVTNVNNASLVTGSFPSEHGITTNFRYDRATRQYSPMESSEFLLRPTIFERARKLGRRTAMATSKDKVRTLCARGVDAAVSAEQPDPAWIGRIGQQESMYSAAVNYWTFRAARHLLRNGMDLVYLSTTDYMMHTYAPEEEPSFEHLHVLDKLLAEILDDHPKIEVYLTADHGMNAMTEAIDVARVLRTQGIEAEAVPIIRDKHVVHHRSLGGACYVYLARPSDLRPAASLLRKTDGIEEVYDAKTAARKFHLHPERIGDLFLLARKHVAFGALERERDEVKVRSHGSRYEADVPLIVYGRKAPIAQYEYNLHLTQKLSLEDS